MSRMLLNAILVAGLITTAGALTRPAPAAAAEEPAKVRHHHPMLFTNSPARAYEELGLVGGNADLGKFNSGRSMDAALADMEDYARALGADAVISVQFASCGIGDSGQIFVIGTAVRWKEGGRKSEAAPNPGN